MSDMKRKEREDFDEFTVITELLRTPESEDSLPKERQWQLPGLDLNAPDDWPIQQDTSGYQGGDTAAGPAKAKQQAVDNS